MNILTVRTAVEPLKVDGHPVESYQDAFARTLNELEAQHGATILSVFEVKMPERFYPYSEYWVVLRKGVAE